MMLRDALSSAALALALVLAGCARTTETAGISAPLPSWTPAACPTDRVNLLVFGDWGAGGERQQQVAATLADYAGAAGPFNAVLSTGDNVYTKLKNVNDPNWGKLFEQMYDPGKLNIPFYAVLGNHDYDDKKDRVQLEYTAKRPESRFKLPARWYRLDLPAEQPLVTVLMLDSNHERLSRAQWAAQRQWIEQELARPRQTRWLVVCAHHPAFSNGDHGDQRRIQQEWGELFRQHRVDFVFNGHDHSLQHLRPEGWTTDFVISGGGGRTRTSMKRSDRGPFSRKLYGFAQAKFTPASAEVTLVDGLTGQTVHQFARATDGGMMVATTTASDKATAASAPKVNTPAHRAIKAEGTGHKEMASILSFSESSRAAFDRAVKSGDERSVMHSLSLPQAQRWAGYMLYASVIDAFGPAGLSDEQKQQAFAACAALATVAVDRNAADKNPPLEPDEALRARAADVIREQILSSVQRKKLAEKAGQD